MNYVRLSPEQQQAVCEDLLTIDRARRMSDVWETRRQILREQGRVDVWEQVAIDRLTKQAAALIGGTRGYWREAAAAALGILSVADVGIEAVCRVADDVRWQEEPEPRPEPRQESRQVAPRARLTIGSRKRGGR